MPLRDELLPADLAPIVSLTFVALQVHVQVAFLCEIVATDLTLERFDPEVLAKVDLKT